MAASTTCRCHCRKRRRQRQRRATATAAVLFTAATSTGGSFRHSAVAAFSVSTSSSSSRLFHSSSRRIAVPVTPSSSSHGGCIFNAFNGNQLSCLYVTDDETIDSFAKTNTCTDSDDTERFNGKLESIAIRSTPTSPNVQASLEAEAMLVDAISDYRSDPKDNIRPDRLSFEHVMQAYLNLGRARFDDPQTQRNICSGDKLADLHRLMEEFWEEEGRPDCLSPTQGTFNAVLAACAACAGPHATLPVNGRRRREREQRSSQQQQVNYAAEAESFLGRMQDLCTELYGDDEYALSDTKQVNDTVTSEQSLGCRPDATSYSLLAAAWARQQPLGSGGTSWAGYERHSFSSSDDLINSSTSNKNNGKTNGECAAKAEEKLRVLEAMLTESDDGEMNDPVDDIELPYLLAEGYDDILAAWCRSGAKDSPLKADDVLRRWEAMADDLDEWTIDATIWEQSDELENDEEDLSPLSIIPTSEAYTTVILAHALSQSTLGPRRAASWLQRTLELYEKGKFGQNRPDVVAFNAVITAFSKSNEDGSAEEAEQWLNRLEGLRAQFDDDRYKYISTDVVSYNAGLSGWLRQIERSNRKKGGKGNQNTIDLERKADAMQRAKQLFDRMNIQCISGDNPDVCPNSRTYASLIYAYCRSGLGLDAADASRKLLMEMEDKYRNGNQGCKPSLQLYSATITSYARSGDVQGAKEAIDLLDHLIDLSSEGLRWEDLTPDIIIYTSVLDAIAKTRMDGGAEYALNILETVERSYEETADALCAPNTRFYTAVVFVLANCRQEGNAQRALDILQKMENEYDETGDFSVLPTSFSYNYAINCAANTLGDLEIKASAFKCALCAFQSIRKSTTTKPNSFTYAFFLKACNSLLPLGDARYNIISQAMNECVKAGMLSDEVIRRLRKGVPAALGRKLLGYPDNYPVVQAKDLPPEWSCNVNRK